MLLCKTGWTGCWRSNSDNRWLEYLPTAVVEHHSI